MIVEGTFWITGRGLVATGVCTHKPPVGQVMEIERPGLDTIERKCMGVEQHCIYYEEGRKR